MPSLRSKWGKNDDCLFFGDWTLRGEEPLLTVMFEQLRCRGGSVVSWLLVEYLMKFKPRATTKWEKCIETSLSANYSLVFINTFWIFIQLSSPNKKLGWNFNPHWLQYKRHQPFKIKEKNLKLKFLIKEGSMWWHRKKMPSHRPSTLIKKTGNLDQFSLYSCLFPFQFLGLALQQSKSSFGFFLSDYPN